MAHYNSCHTCIFILLASCLPRALASCQGNACPKQEAAAKAAGLLGSSVQGACVPQQYPKQGALLPVTLSGRIMDLVWARGPEGSANPKTVFGLLADVDGFAGGPLWRSDYYGRADSWKDMTPTLQAALPANETAAHAGVVRVVTHPVQELLLFQGRGRWHWLSSDSGQSFTAVPSPGGTVGFGQEIKTHPNQPNWLLAKVRRDECQVDYHSPACGFDLFVSKDFGGSWANLTAASAGRVSSFRNFEWGAQLAKYATKPTPDEAMFATAYAGASAHKGFYPGWDQNLHYIVTLDLFASPLAKIIPCGNLFEVVAGKIFLAVPSECPAGPDGRKRKAGGGAIGGRSVTMYVSDEDGDEFVEACLPTPLEDDGYNLVHTHDDAAAFILADHSEPGSWGPTADSPTSDAYAPAYNASLHTLSLPDIYRRDFVTDFSRVEGLPGMYIANQVDPAGRGPGTRGKEAAFLRSRLTLNGGATWQSLPPPASFRFASCNTCPAGAGGEQCRLHLHGPTSWFAPEGPHPNVYTLESAPGLVLSTGSVGPHLDFSPDADCTYLSRDGGLSWEDVADQTTIYEVGNRGGLVLLAVHRSEGPTDHVNFSVDQGGCWHRVQLPENLLVDNIRVDPAGGSHVFLVHGTACLKTDAHPGCTFTGGATPPGKMFSIDVKELLGGDWKECNTADDSPDFEAWALPANGSCLLGAKRTLRRRLRDTFCFYPADWQPQVEVQEACECGAADVECEFGFVRDTSGACVPLPGVSAQDACPRLANSGYLSSSTHLRLVHADVCLGVNDLIPDTNGRGGAKGASGGGDSGGSRGGGIVRSFFLFILIGGALAVAGGLAWTHCLAPGQREQLQDRLAPLLGMLAAGFELVLGLVIEAYDWARAKVQALPFVGGGRGGFDAQGAYEPLSESGGGGGLEMDPEDLRSPPLFGAAQP